MSADSPLATALAGRYRIEGELGQGGMATVFLAEDLRHHRKVALKVFREELSAGMGSQRFLQEIRMAAGLHHPNILPLYDSGEADGHLYYVMPVAEGESLRDRLDESISFPFQTRSGWPARWRMRSTMPTGTRWCIETSSRETSCSTKATR